MHAQSHLREEFCDLLADYIHSDPTPEQIDRLYLLAGKLWRCTDMMPRDYRDDVEELVHHLDVPAWKRSGTYAAAARHVRFHIDKERARIADQELEVLLEAATIEPAEVMRRIVAGELEIAPALLLIYQEQHGITSAGAADAIGAADAFLKHVTGGG